MQANYLRLWQQNWLLILFIVIAFLSLFWSVAFSASLYRSAALLFSSLIGAYIGMRYSLKGLLDILSRFGIFLLLVCFALALFYPAAGAMDWAPYNGAWRGVFWHKNQFGSIAALFTLVFAIGALNGIGKKDGRPTMYFAFYLFSAVVIYFSKSVAGYALCMIVSFCTLLAFLWLKIRHRLTPVHYYSALGLGILAAAVVWFNLDFILGLFNRDTSLTGRIPMWGHLLRDVIAKSPWIGHGFGALWYVGSFQVSMQQAVGWGFPIVIADNGFLDILLHVGLLGLIPFLGILVVMFIRSIKLVSQYRSLINFFPLVLMIFAIAANISFSLFLETETFIWLVMVASLFVVTRELQPDAIS
ncbi:MAG: O-antigen ligase family protein [Anaerolineales bacterium]|nr:O-antigen ligase family protein [Anaerolineales bacterium]